MLFQGGNISVVENFNENEGYKCGYCKSKTSNYSHGMWAHQLTVQDYQELIDRGWRRSGNYCYKPTMKKICCPMYTIKCNALNFILSKSQKKVIKRMNKFLGNGEQGKQRVADDGSNAVCHQEESDGNRDWMEAQHAAKFASDDGEKLAEVKSSLQQLVNFSEGKNRADDTHSEEGTLMTIKTIGANSSASLDTSQDSKCPKPGQGPSEGKPPCKKAKLMRRERRQQRLANKGIVIESFKKHDNTPKKLEDLLHPEIPPNPAHRLQLKLVRSDSLTSYDQMWLLFAKYQKIIHGDEEEDCDRESFRQFLMDTPLKPWRPADDSGPPQGYGSFHQQYWLDDKLIAVGVVDILPRCVSSVYFYYDPDYSDLTLGTYGSLREVAFVRTLNLNAPELKWYYMGYYIHSCLKMRYKAGLSPSMLLCPETYTWHPVEYCLPLLNKDKYCRLEPDSSAIDTNILANIRDVLVFCDGRPMYYRQYRELKGNAAESEDEEVEHYAELVGGLCAKRIFLLR